MLAAAAVWLAACKSSVGDRSPAPPSTAMTRDAAVAPATNDVLVPSGRRCPDLAACQSACDRCTSAACAPDDARACQHLGDRYARGVDLELQPARAVPLLERACDHGRATACLDLSVLYQIGRGVAEDDARAASLLERGCDAGAGMGCLGLAGMVEDGPLDPDPARVEALVRRAKIVLEGACEGGDLETCMALAAAHDMGAFGEPDRVRVGAPA